MGNIVRGDVVVVPFPFSDLTATKKRPAVVVAQLEGDDFILAQITSTDRNDVYAINLMPKDFKEGMLPQTSSIRPNKLFTADKSLIICKIGSLQREKMKEIEQKLIKIFTE